MKLFIYTTDIEATLKDDFAWSLTVSDRDDLGDVGVGGWYLITDIEVDINVDREQLTKLAVSDIDKKITEVNAATSIAITELKTRQQNLLALTQEAPDGE
jgi:hypothetical protein